MSESYKFSLGIDKLDVFLEKVKDLSAISDEILMKINKDFILLYAIVGEKNTINAFKSFIIKTTDIFDFDDEIESELRFIIENGNKFDTIFKNYFDYNEDMQCEFFMNDDTYSDNLHVKNSKLKLSIVGGDPRGINTNIDIEKIKETINLNNVDFKFKLDKMSYTKIKKMSSIESDNDILTLIIEDNKLSIGERNWNLYISDISHSDLNITFPKKYFKSITFAEDEVEVFVFDSFLLVDNKNTSLLISLELSV